MTGGPSKLLTFSGSMSHDPKILEWFANHPNELGAVAKHWFHVMRRSGQDVTELLHDGYPTVCVGDAPFAYVGTFKHHVNVGFFQGAGLDDPLSLLAGSGKRMRHVKIMLNSNLDKAGLEMLITQAYQDIKLKIRQEQ